MKKTSISRSLADLFVLRRRYQRSVNLERDLEVLDSIDGYIPTPRALEALERIGLAHAEPGTVRAWTLTGVYGTGKSAFAQLIAALYGPVDDPMRQRALAILNSDRTAARLARLFKRLVPEAGFVRAVVTGRREPIAATVLRALGRGVDRFWGIRHGRRPAVVERVQELNLALARVTRPSERITANVAELIRDVTRVTQGGLLLVIDELGKALEYAGQAERAGDLFLLQELAELSSDPRHPPVLVLGLLHQAYSEYGHGLTAVERSEWDKIQGRFEDIPFAESGEQMLRLVAQVIEPVKGHPLATSVEHLSKQWANYLRHEQHSHIADTLPAARVAAVYPLHPVAALVLPALCAKYAQNDRSLFTFLTSNEPHSLSRFLVETSLEGAAHGAVSAPPLLKLPRVYDYFVDAAWAGVIARPQFQRWAEVHSVVRDAQGVSDVELAALKVVGTLNLVTSSGPLRASKALSIAALLDRPDDPAEARRWRAVFDRLLSRGLVTYRQQVDEYRIWEGSDFDVEEAIRAHVATDHRSLADILSAVAALPPVVAQRHSYRTGTMRYFERRYVKNMAELGCLTCDSPESDGAIAYWVDLRPPESVPSRTTDGRPLVVIPAASLGSLAAAAQHHAALVALDRSSPALQADGVARREVRQRLAFSRRVLDDALRTAFDTDKGGGVWAGGELRSCAPLGSILSDLCDDAYSRGPTLWNELINRRELTSQGARARRMLIEALLTNTSKPRLGLVGDGPEVSMYASVLSKTGIHREETSVDAPSIAEGVREPRWIVCPPTDAGIRAVWKALEAFCMDATHEPRRIDELYLLLQAPPYGVKQGIIPVLLAAMLVYHSDDVSIYRDGTFLPTLGAEHFELLVKMPSRFTVKHFSLTGIRLQLFHELEKVLRRTDTRNAPSRTRNITLLGVVRPLVRFATSLPVVTRKTKRMSVEALAVRDALLSSVEPDVLLFETLPVACGFVPFAPTQATERTGLTVPTDEATAQLAEAFRHTLFRALRELQGYHEQLLERCRSLIHSAFGIRSDLPHLREDLRVRSQYLVGQVLDPRLRSFVLAAANPDLDDRGWLESLAMIVADRPSETWTDDDTLAFEVHLSDVARRFANLEALQKEAAREGREGFDARRITVTSANGVEVHRLVWIGRNERRFVEEKLHELLALVRALPKEHQRHAIAMALVEDLLGGEQATIDLGASKPSPVLETDVAEKLASRRQSPRQGA